ncbi:hypothetical protein LSAT2_022094, partial [Lamellibrachia satsuma]
SSSKYYYYPLYWSQLYRPLFWRNVSYLSHAGDSESQEPQEKEKLGWQRCRCGSRVALCCCVLAMLAVALLISLVGGLTLLSGP